MREVLQSANEAGLSEEAGCKREHLSAAQRKHLSSRAKA
jgi:hypothetical protein